MPLHIPRDEQIKIVRNAAIAMRAAVKSLADTNFDEDVFERALSLEEGVKDVLHDACIDLLRTDAELDEVASQMLDNVRFGSYEAQNRTHSGRV